MCTKHVKSTARKSTTAALLKISGHAKGTVTAATQRGCQTSLGYDGRNRYWLGARQVLQSSFQSRRAYRAVSHKGSQRECREMAAALDSPLPLVAPHTQAKEMTHFM